MNQRCTLESTADIHRTTMPSELFEQYSTQNFLQNLKGSRTHIIIQQSEVEPTAAPTNQPVSAAA